MSAQSQSLLAPEQYLEIERRAETRSEYWRGDVRHGRSQPRALPAQNQPCGRFGPTASQEAVRGLFERYARLDSCNPMYTYPDVVAVWGEPRLTDDHADTLVNPALLAEILSPSTEAYDRGRKFEHYRAVESLQEYLLVAQDRMHVDLFTRQPGGNWLLREAARPEEVLELKSIGCQLPLTDLYEKVHFPGSNGEH